MKYIVMIKWSEEDKCFAVGLPEFNDVMQPVTGGHTYEQAVKNAQKVLELIIDSYQKEGKPLPTFIADWDLIESTLFRIS